MYRAGRLLLGVILLAAAAVSATEVENVSRIVAVGKSGPTACWVKLETANFNAVCPTAIYRIAYFSCSASEGQEWLSIALTGYASEKPARITSTGCSAFGSSGANLTAINLE